MATVKCLPVHHHSADYIFWSFGNIRLILGQFENRVPLKPVLRGGMRGQCYTITLPHMNSLNETESAICVALMCSLLPEDLHSDLIIQVCTGQGLYFQVIIYIVYLKICR